MEFHVTKSGACFMPRKTISAHDNFAAAVSAAKSYAKAHGSAGVFSGRREDGLFLVKHCSFLSDASGRLF